MISDCFDTLGGVPAKVLADRMGCLKGGTVANVAIPIPDYVRFATHYRFVPDFCHPADPEPKGLVENLVGYAKTDLVLPDSDDLTRLNDACRTWCSELPKEIIEIVDDILPAHGPELVAKALVRAARFGRFRAADVRSILAIGTALIEPVAGGDNVAVALPAAEVRSFDAYRIENLA